jgi:hypothetical protein
MAKFRAVTHCSAETHKAWPVLYTMIHGHGRDKCGEIAKQMSAKVGIRDYVLLFSEKEFKKTSMQYF